MLSECRRFKTQFGGPCRHDFSCNAAKTVPVLRIDALTPALATVLFTLGPATAGFALLCRRNQACALWFDIAGVLTFVGVAVSILIEPDQMVRFFIFLDQPD